MFRYIFLAIVFCFSCFADSPETNKKCPDGKKHYRTAIRHIESGGIGYDSGYTTLEAFLSSDPSQWKVTPFFDARGHIFDNGRWAANAGVGLRALWRDRVYGINTYYDYRNTDRLTSNQIGAGIETLGELFDFRLNGYLPLGVKTSNPYDSVFETFSGNYLLISQKIQSAMKGANAEFGFHFGESKNFDFYAAAGPYYFIGKAAPATWGGKARFAGIFKDILTLEISDSYDRTFHNKFQGLISLSFFFGPKSKIKEQGRTCKKANTLNDRMLQPVNKQEIIVVDKIRKNTPAINPATGLPYFFVFVNNTSSSAGTYESPYPSLAQAQNNSSPNDIIYVFPGNGTTAGMDAGIALKANQKFWGSGISHSIQTTTGTISIPAQSNSSPTITNTDFDTEGNAITLATNNAISGFNIASAINNAIFGTNPQSLQVSSCIFENTATYPIEAFFVGDASISLTNNQFLNNVNGVLLTLNGASIVVCSNNIFKGQTSVSSSPFEIAAESNINTILVENNVFTDNITGSIRFGFGNPLRVDISILNNVMTNSGTGSQASLGSSFAVISTGTTDTCSIVLEGNTFSDNTSNSLYMHTSGTFTNLALTASSNTMSNNGGSAFVLATPVTDALNMLASDNMITHCNDNGIAIISSMSTTTSNIAINNNVITDIRNLSNGIAINQDFATLNLTLSNNEINRCEGTGIVSYAPTGIDSLTLNITGNTISNCANMSSNAGSGLDIEQYTNLVSSITNNILSDNTGTAVAIGSTLMNPTACLTLTGNNNSGDYVLTNPMDGLFNLSPCDVDVVNVGTINTSGTINTVVSCPDSVLCPP